MSRIERLSALFFALAGSALAKGEAPAGCTPVDRAGFDITRPGLYCLTKDLDTRLDFADHAAENPVIKISAGDVTVDLRGHRIGRGRLLAQHGGAGFMITTSQLDLEPSSAPRINNVTIRNGTLADFGVGVLFWASRRSVPSFTSSARQTGPNTFTYDAAGIVFENVEFLRCDENTRIHDWVAR